MGHHPFGKPGMVGNWGTTVYVAFIAAVAAAIW